MRLVGAAHALEEELKKFQQHIDSLTAQVTAEREAAEKAAEEAQKKPQGVPGHAPPHDQPNGTVFGSNNPSFAPSNTLPLQPQQPVFLGQSSTISDELARSSTYYQPNKSLFVCNLDHRTSETSFRTLFSEFENVGCTRVVFDRHTQICKGFGYAEFADALSAERAMQSLRDREFEAGAPSPDGGAICPSDGNEVANNSKQPASKHTSSQDSGVSSTLAGPPSPNASPSPKLQPVHVKQNPSPSPPPFIPGDSDPDFDSSTPREILDALMDNYRRYAYQAYQAGKYKFAEEQ
ncbi:MAG: hypothetical protein M1820_008529 [Bogoriella megaspora]|nr:MAG: hypothetical protein M1820_008529 [Bogoriella megaspora]